MLPLTSIAFKVTALVLKLELIPEIEIGTETQETLSTFSILPTIRTLEGSTMGVSKRQLSLGLPTKFIFTGTLAKVRCEIEAQT